jgi:hypothetical protein
MNFFFILFSVLIGIGAGMGLTALVVGPSGALLMQQAGGWEFSPRIGSPEIDPYSRARLFFEGELPLAAGEGYSLRARRDALGDLLRTQCTYSVKSPFPVARYWTMTLTDTFGHPIPNLAGRNGFTSAEIIRISESGFSIDIGPHPLAGNWLPTGGEDKPFELVLRFYETPLSATATQFDPRLLPVISPLGCT